MWPDLNDLKSWILIFFEYIIPLKILTLMRRRRCYTAVFVRHNSVFNNIFNPNLHCVQEERERMI
jgi:hypothetical protein